MTTTQKAILTGHTAIAIAAQHRLTVSKYADPIEGARDGVTVAEAREIASEDPSLIYLEIPAASKIYRIADSSGSRTILAATSDEAAREYQRLERIRARVETVADLAAALEGDGDWLIVHEGEDLVYMTQGR